ncbi:MAG: hypothetical protein MZV64_38115 [Ignavibacteriales bacterium]|nr:hypothetical protein [Ignavibacteriales bacterium]
MFVTLKIYDILGNEVALLVNEYQSPGNYEIKFEGKDFPSGIYFYRLSTSELFKNKINGFNQMKIKVIALVLALSSCVVSQTILTPLEKSNYSKLTSHDELSEFIHLLDQSSDLLKVEILGKSIEDEPIAGVLCPDTQVNLSNT